MEQTISESLAQRRFTMLVLMIFAATALLLAAVGIYGVMSMRWPAASANSEFARLWDRRARRWWD